MIPDSFLTRIQKHQYDVSAQKTDDTLAFLAAAPNLG